MKQKLSLLVLALLCLMGGAIAANAFREAAATTVTWEFSTWDNGEITETKTVDGLTVAATSDKKVTIDENSKTFGEVSYTKRLKLGGTGAADSRNLSFKVTGPCTITVDFAHASGSGDARTLKLDAGAFGTAATSQSVDAGSLATLTYNYEGTGEQTFFLYSANSGLNIYGITVKYAETTEPEEPIVGGVSYTKVTSAADVTDGEYLIVYEGENVAFNGALESLDVASNVVDVTINDGVIASSEAVDAATFTINTTEKSVKSASGFYIGQNSYANGLKTSADTKYVNDIAFDEAGNVLMSVAVNETQAVTLKFNAAADQKRFRYYKSGQKDIQLYKKTQAVTPDPQPTLPGTPVWTSDEAVTADWGSAAIKAEPAALPADLKVGDIIHVAVEVPNPTPGNAWSAQVVIKDGAYTDLEAGLPVGTGEIEDAAFTITGDILKYIKTYGLQISGANYATRLVTIEKTNLTGSDASVWVGQSASSITVNANHLKNANDKAGIEAGDIIRVTGANMLGYEGDKWIILQYSGNDTNWEWKVYEDMGAQETETGYDFVVTEANVEQLKTDGFIVNQPGFFGVSQIELVKPEPVSDEPVDITISPEEGDIYAALEAAKEGVNKVGNITINLGARAAYTVSNTIVANKGLTVNGNGAVIDASALTAPLFAMNAEPQIDAVESGQFVVTDPITIDGINVKGITKAFFADNGKGYAYTNLTINNCLVEYETLTNVALNMASSMAINLNMTNNTFWSKAPGTANFIAMSGKRPWQITGFEEEKGKFTCANNTFYNIAKSKQFMNTNTLKGQRYLYEFNSNIFVNTSNKKIYGNMTNNKNQLTTDGKNTYMMDGAFFAETNYNGDEGLQTDPMFADPDNGDFTVKAFSDQAKYQTGDPRWLVEYEEMVLQEGQWIAGEQGFADKQNIEEAELVKHYQLTFSKSAGAMAPVYWESNKAVRVFKGNEFKIAGNNITKVTIHYASAITGIYNGVITATPGEIVEDTEALTWVWTGLTNEVTFTNTAITPLYITAIDIEYLIGKSVYDGRNDLADEIEKAEALLADETQTMGRDDLAAAIEEAKKHVDTEDPYELIDAIDALKAAEEKFIDVNTPKDVVLDLPTGADIATELAAATEGRLVNSITINLAANGQYTVSAPLEAMTSIVIKGDEEAPAKIDASSNADAFILLSKTPQVPEISSYFRLDNITIANVEVSGLKNNIVFDNNTKYCVVSMTIDNCLFALATEAVSYEALIAFQAGGIKDFAIMNSTVYGNNDVAKYFIRYNNSARLDRFGYDKDTEYQTMTYVNNTFVNLLNAEGQWGNYSAIAGQNYIAYVVESNIWYNCGKDIIRRLAGGRFGASAPCDFGFNTYFNGGEDQSASEASYDKSETILTTDPMFADIANADFTLYAGSDQAKYQTGDPRWWIEFDPALGITSVNAEKQYDNNWYNLQGVRVERPTKGIFIHNGKKVVIK